MVVLNSSIDNQSNSVPSSPSALHLWKRFKNEKDKEKPLRKPENKRRQVCQSMNSLSSSFLDKKAQNIKRTVVQEKLMNWQLQSHRQKQSDEFSFSTDSSFNSSGDRQRRHLYLDDYHDKENNTHVNMTNVLHLKKPLSVNSDNAKKYYEDRGRMEPINWKSNPSNSIYQGTKPEVKNKPEMSKETIKTIAISKPQISDEFSNFVKNSVSKTDAYNTQGNIERNVNAIDCPIFKIQQLINKKPLETIRIPASVRTSFLESRSSSHLFNGIDSFKVLNPSETIIESTGTARLDEACVNNRAVPNGNSHNNQYKDMPKGNQQSFNAVKSTNWYDECNKVPKQDDKSFSNDVKARNTGNDNLQGTNWSQKTEVKREKETKDHRPTHDCDDDDMVSYVNSLSHEENVAKRESRKQGMNIKDDLFDFVQYPLESNSEILKSQTPSAKKISSYNYPFNRIKAVCREKAQANKTLDSDDTFNISSDIDSLSVSVLSTRDRFRAFKKKKLENTTSCERNVNSSILPDENDDTKVLENKNHLLNRCLRASHHYLKLHENNVVEITNVKIGPKPEPLLRPISTRYFPKPSTDTEKLSNNNNSSNKLKQIEHLTPSVSTNPSTKLLNSNPIKNLHEEKTKKSYVELCTANIDDISPITTSNVEGIDSKTDLKNESNDNISIEIREIDSGSCLENYLVEPDIDGTKLDLKMDNEKNYDVLRCKDLIEPINISGNIESSVQSENQYSKKSDTKSKTIKDECKFEVISSDSESKIMDCKDVIDFEAFEVENIDLWFPSLPSKVQDIKKAFSNAITNDNEMLSITENPDNSKIQSLESDLDSSNNINSSFNASVSSNLNSDSDNLSSPCSLFNFDSVFEKVDIKLSELKTSGLDYNDNQTKKNTNQNISQKNKDVHLDLNPINCKEDTLKQISSAEKVVAKDENLETNRCSMHSKTSSASQEKLYKQKNTEKENYEQHFNTYCDDSSSNHSEKPNLCNDNVAITPKQISHKMQKYRNTLKNYKHKLKNEADTKEEEKNVQQSANESQDENIHLQESLQQRQILKEIQKHKLHLTFKKFV